MTFGEEVEVAEEVVAETAAVEEEKLPLGTVAGLSAAFLLFTPVESAFFGGASVPELAMTVKLALSSGVCAEGVA